MKKNRASTNIIHPLVGTWGHAHFLARWIVSASNGKLLLEGVDTSSGEKFKVSKLSWTGTRLKFVSIYPPTGRVVSHECRALSRRKMEITLAYDVKEVWVRSTSQDNSTKRSRFPVPRSKRSWLVGKWHSPNGEDPRTLCAINLTNDRLNVRAEDIGDGERMRVTDVRWNGRALSFKTRVPSTGQICHRIVEPISSNKLRATLKFRESDIWKRDPNLERNPAK